MKIDILSDLHGNFPQTEGGDLLILAGDYTATEKIFELSNFFSWLKDQNYKKKIIIGGNHDNFLFTSFPKTKKEAEEMQDIQEMITEENLESSNDFEYLCDSGTEVTIDNKILKIWGTPWTCTFPKMNPKCKAFTFDSEMDLADKFDLIPEDTDVLICHGPPYGVLDENKHGEHCGSISLLYALDRVKPRFMIFGHIHEQGGKSILYKHSGPNTKCFNVSYIDENHKPKNKITTINLK